MFGRNKELQKEIVPLSNIFSNRLNGLIDSFDKEDIISCCQNRNAKSPQLPAIGRDKVTGHSEPKQ